MSEMIERVARAIAKAYSGIDNYDWTAFEDEARAAIEAMGEPTEAMRHAALLDNRREPFQNRFTAFALPVGCEMDASRKVYLSMIDAALQSPPNSQSGVSE